MKSLPLSAKLWVVKFYIRFFSTGKMMKIMGVYSYNILPCCLEEAETPLHVLQCYLLETMETFVEALQDLNISLEYMYTETSLLKYLLTYI